MLINVNASKQYFVQIENSLDYLNTLPNYVKGDKVAIITDSNVNSLYGNILDKYLEGKQIYHYVIEGGEDSKNAENYIKILNFLAENSFKRSDTIIAFGGGVVGDLAGFCSATYMRGINLIMIPTTLLSMVDSSIGGKTAINLESGKNLAGAFYQPSFVFICTKFLNTLPKREINSGMGEIYKYIFIGGTLSLADVKSDDIALVIKKCVEIKRDIVEKDEKESGDRKLLNLGHTIGHAIEKAKDFKFSHGECVLKGLNCILDVSYKLNLLTKENLDKAKDILNTSGCDLTFDVDKDTLFKYFKNDKKGEGEYLDIVVVNDNLLCSTQKIKIKDFYNLI